MLWIFSLCFGSELKSNRVSVFISSRPFCKSFKLGELLFLEQTIKQADKELSARTKPAQTNAHYYKENVFIGLYLLKFTEQTLRKPESQYLSQICWYLKVGEKKKDKTFQMLPTECDAGWSICTKKCRCQCSPVFISQLFRYIWILKSLSLKHYFSQHDTRYIKN